MPCQVLIYTATAHMPGQLSRRRQPLLMDHSLWLGTLRHVPDLPCALAHVLHCRLDQTLLRGSNLDTLATCTSHPTREMETHSPSVAQDAC